MDVTVSYCPCVTSIFYSSNGASSVWMRLKVGLITDSHRYIITVILAHYKVFSKKIKILWNKVVNSSFWCLTNRMKKTQIEWKNRKISKFEILDFFLNKSGSFLVHYLNDFSSEKSLKATDLEYDSFKHAFLTLPIIFVAWWKCMSLSNVLFGGCFQTFSHKMIKS